MAINQFADISKDLFNQIKYIESTGEGQFIQGSGQAAVSR